MNYNRRGYVRAIAESLGLIVLLIAVAITVGGGMLFGAVKVVKWAWQ